MNKSFYPQNYIPVYIDKKKIKKLNQIYEKYGNTKKAEKQQRSIINNYFKKH